MEFRTTYTEAGRSAYTLLEMMVAIGLSLILAAAIATLAFFSSRSFVGMANYADLNQRGQIAMDKLSKDIRQARKLTSYATNSLTFEDADGNPLTYTYSPTAKTLVRVGGGKTSTYLTECNSLNFGIYQHTMKSNMFVCYDVAMVTNARVIQVNWNCSRKIKGKNANTEAVQTAEIVLRNH